VHHLPVQMAVAHCTIALVTLTPQVPHLIGTLHLWKWLALLSLRATTWLNMTAVPIPPVRSRLLMDDVIIAGLTLPNSDLQLRAGQSRLYIHDCESQSLLILRKCSHLLSRNCTYQGEATDSYIVITNTPLSYMLVVSRGARSIYLTLED
jgi:hypothetical protein